MEKWSKATPQEKARKLVQRWEDLKTKRSPFISQWRDVAEMVSPFSGRFDVHDHGNNRSFDLIMDSEGRQDLSILSSGLMSGISSPARAWFKLLPHDENLLDDYATLNWCDDVQKKLLKVFHSSNTYNALQQLYTELCLFGIGADLVYEHDSSIIKHHVLTVGEYCVETNADGDIDTLYRNFELTTSQCIKLFGLEALPKQIQDAYYRHDLSTYWEFIHAIEPRIDRDYKSEKNEHFAWASYYVSLTTEPKVIKESGFNYFPCVVPRWEVLGVDPYGSSPSMIALPDLRQLNQEVYRKAELIDLYTKPPLQAPNSARQNPISLSSGAINFTQNTSNENAIKPIIQSVGDLNALMLDINNIKDSIKRSFYVDLFQMVQQTSGDRRTTVEISALQQEQMLSLGSVLTRIEDECLDQLITITCNRMLELGELPQPPQAVIESYQRNPSKRLIGKNGILNTKYISVLAQAQDSSDINNVDRLFSALASAGQLVPEIFDRIDPDGYVDEYRERLGVAPKMLRTKEDAEKIRQQRAQAQAQQSQQEQAIQQAQIAQSNAIAQKNGADASLAMQQLDPVGGGLF